MHSRSRFPSGTLTDGVNLTGNGRPARRLKCCGIGEGDLPSGSWKSNGGGGANAGQRVTWKKYGLTDGQPSNRGLSAGARFKKSWAKNGPVKSEDIYYNRRWSFEPRLVELSVQRRFKAGLSLLPAALPWEASTPKGCGSNGNTGDVLG